MQPIIFDFGQIEPFGYPVSLRIYGYGLMMVLGFICAIALAARRARKLGENHHVISSIGLLALIGGVLGARLAYVIERWDERFAPLRRIGKDPFMEILNISSGGLIYYGGVALATAAIVVYVLWRRLPLRRYLDIIAPSLMIGLAFGRVGCLLNGCCHGGRCDADFALAMRFPYASTPLIKTDKDTNVFGGASISPPFAHQVEVGPAGDGMDATKLPTWLVRTSPNADGQGAMLESPGELSDRHAQEALALRSLPVQPAQAYGIVNALLLAGILLCFSRLRWREGQVFAMMLILYPITRIVLESIRGDNPHNLLRMQLTHNQWTSLATTAAGLVMWLALTRLPKACGLTWGERLALQESRKPKSQKHRKGKS